MIGVFKKFSDTFGGILKGKTLDKESLETLEALLYTADFGTETVEKIIEEIQSELKKNPEYKTDASVSIAKAVVESQLIGSEGELKFPFIQLNSRFLNLIFVFFCCKDEDRSP